MLHTITKQQTILKPRNHSRNGKEVANSNTHKNLEPEMVRDDYMRQLSAEEVV